jgi:hypothetical protein
MTLTVERLQEVLSYDPSTGVFTWLIATARRIQVGDIAGSVMTNGYRTIRIDSDPYLAHRLAFFYMIGRWPIECDHKNLLHDDNRWNNLREATHSQNLANQRIHTKSSSGFKGVSWFERDRKWRAQIKINYKDHHLGYFDTAESAHAAYVAAASAAFNEFARSK